MRTIEAEAFIKESCQGDDLMIIGQPAPPPETQYSTEHKLREASVLAPPAAQMTPLFVEVRPENVLAFNYWLGAVWMSGAPGAAVQRLFPTPLPASSYTSATKPGSILYAYFGWTEGNPIANGCSSGVW